MKRIEKAEKIAVMLEELYPETPVPLDHENPFQLLVAVLMSAQTTDLKVNEVTPALFAKAPNAKEMAELPVEVILADIRQVGLAPTKAKNIKRMAELLMEKHDGEFQHHSRNSRLYRESDTKPLVLLWLNHSVFLHSQLILIFTALPLVGDYPTAKMSRKPRKT